MSSPTACVAPPNVITLLSSMPASDTAIAMSPARRAPAGRGALRLVARVWLVVYALLALGVPLADASAEHAAPVVAHWEDAESGTCPAPHGETCEVCQQLSGSRGMRASATVSWAPCGDADGVMPVRDAARPARAGFDRPSSRAPPLS